MKKKNKIKILILLTVTLAFLCIFSIKNDVKLINNNHDYLERSDYWDLTSSPIIINDTDPTRKWVYTASSYDWCSGSGSLSDPYIIENVTIDAGGTGSGILIENSRQHFIIRNCTIFNSGFDTLLWPAKIKMENVTNGILENNNCSGNGRSGIYIVNCSNNVIKNNILRYNFWSGGGYGLSLKENSNNNIITQNSLEYNGGLRFSYGIGIFDSNNNLIKCEANLVSNP